MATFLKAYKITMGNEGGYSNDPNDHGGETYMGIARNFWPKWPGWSLVETIMAQSPDNFNAALNSNATLQADVQAFYKANFWDTLLLDELNSQQIANQLFDTGVNMGTGIAARFLQTGVNNLKPGTLKVDSMVGPLTIAAANAEGHENLYNQIIQLRRQRYEQIIAANPSQAVFTNSWFSRMSPFNAALD